MRFHGYLFGFLSIVLTLPVYVTSAPTQSSSSKLPRVNNNLIQDLRLPRLPNHVNASLRLPSPSLRNGTTQAYIMDWPISDTLSLRIQVGEWRLSAARIVQILDNAQFIIGKKVASARLTDKFVVSTGRYLNTLVFEIEPVLRDEGLRWADVAEIASDGLPSYFQNTENWRSTFFEIFKKAGDEWVNVGEGAVRKKWYQLDLPSGEMGNSTVREKR